MTEQSQTSLYTRALTEGGGDEKIKQKKGKVRLDLIPMGVLKGVAEVMEFGLTKYEEDSWKQVPPEDYLAAAERHMLLGMHEGGLDSRAEDSKLRHVYHAICDLMFIAHIIEDSRGEIHDPLVGTFEDYPSEECRHVYPRDGVYQTKMTCVDCGHVREVDSETASVIAASGSENTAKYCGDEEIISPKPDCIHEWFDGDEDIRPHCIKCGKKK